MRSIVVTGSAGSGTSTVAAALAHRWAGEGSRTVLVRAAGSGAPPPDMDPAGPALEEVDPLAWGTAQWDAAAAVRQLLGRPWSGLGGEAVLPLPGLSELAWWGTLRRIWGGRWDHVIVDAGPVAEAVRWLTVPDLTVGLLRRIWPMTERTGDAAGRLAEGSWHLRAMARLESEASDLADRVRSAATAIHVVTEPQPHELGRALSALTPLALFELPVTDLVVNRVRADRAYDRALVARLTDQLPGCLVSTADDRDLPPAPHDLGRELYPDLSARDRPLRPRVGRSGDRFLWSWPLPFADPTQVAAVATGDDLVLTVGSARRVVPLPSVLRRCRLERAVLRGAVLRLSFTPDPDVWPAPREVA